MNATAITSVSSRFRLLRARSWLESLAKAEEVVIVGATLDAANELARQVARGKGAAFGWHRLSLAQLAAAIAAPALATRGIVSLSRIGTEAIVARLVHRLRDEGGLGRYQSVSETPGFSRAMTDVIAELRSARLRSNSLERVVPHLLPIVREYEHELAEGGFTDRSGMLELATNAVAGFDRHRLVGLPALFLDVAISTEAELAFVTEFAAASPAMLATIPTADVSTLKRFRDRLGFKIENLDHAAGADNAGGAATNALARLQRHLFNEHEKPSEIEASNEIEIFSAPGEGRECVEIARRVLALARDLVPFDRIAVLLRSPEVYRSYLVEAFSRSEIPVHFARGAVRPEPAGKYVIAADGARSTVGSLADRPIVRFRVHQRTIALCRYRYRSCGGVCDTAGPLLCAKR